VSTFFGSRDRFAVSQKAKKTYDLIVTKHKLLRSHAQLFAYAASCGLAAGKRTKVKSKEDLAIMSGLKSKDYDYDYESLFGVVISHLHPDASPDERLQILQEYAEFGIIKIRAHFNKYRRLSFQRLIQDLSGRDDTLE
jgi:hypothetical protein